MTLRTLTDTERTTLTAYEGAVWPLEVEVLTDCDEMEHPAIPFDTIGFVHPDFPGYWRWTISVSKDNSAELSGPDYGRGEPPAVILPSLWMALEVLQEAVQGRVVGSSGAAPLPGSHGTMWRQH